MNKVLMSIELIDSKFAARMSADDFSYEVLVNGAATAVAACYNMARLQDPDMDFKDFFARVMVGAMAPEQNKSARMQFGSGDDLSDPVPFPDAKVPPGFNRKARRAARKGK